MNHHLGVAQKETPYWDYKQNSDLQDTQRIMWAQLSTHKSSVNLSPLLGNTWRNTNEFERTQKWGGKKIRDQETQLTGGKKKQKQKPIKWRIQSAHQAVVSRASSPGITLQQIRYCLEGRENLQKGEQQKGEMDSFVSHSATRSTADTERTQLNWILWFFPALQCAGLYWCDETLITIYAFQASNST